MIQAGRQATLTVDRVCMCEGSQPGGYGLYMGGVLRSGS